VHDDTAIPGDDAATSPRMSRYLADNADDGAKEIPPDDKPAEMAPDHFLHQLGPAIARIHMKRCMRG